jgi:hypothetical protein
MSEVKVNKISPRTNCGTTQLGDAGDTITVTGDLKSNSLKSASGSTITLGQSGDTIQLGCGASQQVLVVQVQWIGIRLRRQLHLQQFQEMVIL